LCHKRLSQGSFRWWPTSPGEAGRFLQAHQLQVLVAGGNPEAAEGAPPWRPVLPPV
jgi:hypothetical protein